MTPAPLLLALLAAPPPGGLRQQTVIDETVTINPGKIRTLDLPPRDGPARLLCSHLVTGGGAGVRVLLMSLDDSERFFRGKPHRALSGTAFVRRGSFAHALPAGGDYRIVLDNRLEGRAPVSLHLTVALVHGARATGPVREADPARRRAAIFLSLALFAAIAAPALYALRRVFTPARSTP
jgi:hypothetical protein